MSAADMFVPLGSEHACQNFQKRRYKNAFGKLAGGAIMTASVMLATQLEARGSDENPETESDEIDAFQSASLSSASSANSQSGLSVESVLGGLEDTDGSELPFQVASLGGTRLHSSPASGDFVSETGIPSGLEIESPGVTDPGQETSGFPVPMNAIQTPSNAAPQISGAAVQSQKSNNGLDGENGIDGVDGQSIIVLERGTLVDAGILPLLEDAGIPLVDGPFDTVVLTLTPDQLDQLLDIFDQFVGLPAPNPEPGDDTGNLHLEGTNQDDYIVGGNGDDVILGLAGNDTLVGGTGGDRLDGGEGNDTVLYETSTEGVSIDLAANTAAGGGARDDELVSIENIFGSEFADTLIGDHQDNELHGNGDIDSIFGGEGNDTISGGANADHIDGGAGLGDTAIYFTSDAGVSISLANDTASGGHATGDELDNIENLDGSLHDDFLQGDHLNNRLGGHHGEDVLLGEAGNDTLLGGNLGDLLNGGDGIDTADYTASLEAVHVDLLFGDTSGGEAEGDTLISIENLAGSAHNDYLSGNNTNNRLTGRDGDDTLIGNGGNDRLIGGEGADHLDGGDGDRDAADYGNASGAVGVDLANIGFGGEAEGDTYVNIEFVVGSDFNDEIHGDASVNRLDGGTGDDYLDGRNGNDTLIGGEGHDILAGGEGADVFIFSGNHGDDTIEDFEAGVGRTDRIWLQDHGFENFADLQASITDTDDGAYINLENGSIMLEFVNSADLVADDFILA